MYVLTEGIYKPNPTGTSITLIKKEVIANITSYSGGYKPRKINPLSIIKGDDYMNAEADRKEGMRKYCKNEATYSIKTGIKRELISKKYKSYPDCRKNEDNETNKLIKIRVWLAGLDIDNMELYKEGRERLTKSVSNTASTMRPTTSKTKENIPKDDSWDQDTEAAQSDSEREVKGEKYDGNKESVCVMPQRNYKENICQPRSSSNSGR